MNLGTRLNAIESALDALNPAQRPAGLPASWCEFDDSGRNVGPPPGVVMTEAQRRTWDTLCAMGAAVPLCDE